MKQEKHNLPGEEWRDAVVVVWTLVLTVAAENDAVDGGKTKTMSGEDCCGRWTVVDCWLRERDEEKTDCLRVDGG